MKILIRQGVKSTIYTYIGVFIGFLVSILFLPRMLEKEQLGLVNYMATLPILFAEVIGLGFTTLFSRIFYLFKNKEKKNNGIFFLWLMWFCTGLIVFLIVFFFFRNYFIDERHNPLLHQFIYWAIPLTIAYNIYLVLERYLRYIHFNASYSIFLKEIGVRVGLILCAILFFFKVINFVQFIAFYCIFQMVPAIFLLFKLGKEKELSFKPQLDFLNKELIKKILRITGVSISIGFFVNLAATISNIILEHKVNLSAVATFTIATTLSNIISIPMRVSHSTSEPILRDSFTKGHLDLAFRIYQKSCFIQTIIGIYFYLCLSLNVDNVLWLLPHNYMDVKIPILLISLGTLFDMMTGVNDALIGTSPKYHYSILSPFVLSGFTIFLNILLIPRWGVNGAAAATMFTFLLYNIYRYLFIYFFLGMQPYNASYLKIIILGLVLGIMIYFIPHFLHPIIDLGIRLFLITGLWSALVLYFNLSPDITAFVTKWWNFLSIQLKR